MISIIKQKGCKIFSRILGRLDSIVAPLPVPRPYLNPRYKSYFSHTSLIFTPSPT